MIIITKSFSEEAPIDISHLSQGAQKKIIERERKKIELDQKISATKDTIDELNQRSKMSISDNAKIGAYRAKKNPVSGIASSVGGMGVSAVLSEGASNIIDQAAPGMGSFGKAVVNGVARTVGYQVIPAITKTVGKVSGAVRGLTAESAAKRQEKKLERLSKKREKLEKTN